MWEYQTLRIDVSRQGRATPSLIAKGDQELADLGKVGWEMVGMVPLASVEIGTHSVFCMFKRPKEPEKEQAPPRRPWRALPDDPVGNG